MDRTLIRWRGIAAAPVAAAVCALTAAPASASDALAADAIAGTFDGEAVTLADADRALDGSLSRSWRQIDAVVRTAARGICDARAVEGIAAAHGSNAAGWRVDTWKRSRPSAEDVERFLATSPELPGKPSTSPEAHHALHVKRYRDAVASAITERVGDRFDVHLPDIAASSSERLDGEPRIPERAADCMGQPITRAQIERYAAYPLYRRRADVVSTTCRQFDLDYSNPLLLQHRADAAGTDVDALLRQAEAGGQAPTDEAVERLARERYGAADDAARRKVGFALDAARRVEGRMAFLERMRAETVARCALRLPAPPSVHIEPAAYERGNQRTERDGLRVVYFGAPRCTHCAAGLERLDEIRTRFGDRVYIEFRHHFPAYVEPHFRDALEVECAARQGRFWALVAWQRKHPGGVRSNPEQRAERLGLDAPAFAACKAAPATAVKILEDTDLALRMGFREAVPSWVIGRRPRRGAQGARVLERTIEGELTAPEEAASRGAAD